MAPREDAIHATRPWRGGALIRRLASLRDQPESLHEQLGHLIEQTPSLIEHPEQRAEQRSRLIDQMESLIEQRRHLIEQRPQLIEQTEHLQRFRSRLWRLEGGKGEWGRHSGFVIRHSGREEIGIRDS